MINGDNMKTVVFMGTPDFAVPALKVLADSPEYDVKLVISQPDKPQGRKQILTPSPVKQLALQYGFEIYRQLLIYFVLAFAGSVGYLAPETRHNLIK